MKCPECGAWNTAYLPRCKGCGMPLTENTLKEAPWEKAMHKKKPSLKVIQYDPDAPDTDIFESEEAAFDPDALNTATLTDEMEQLKERRQKGADRLEQMKTQASRVRQSMRDAQIIRPAAEPGDISRSAESVMIRRRQQQRQTQYTSNLYDDQLGYEAQEDPNAYLNHGYFSDMQEVPVTYVDDDEDAPVYYDGFTPEAGDMDAVTDDEYMRRRIQTRAHREDAYESFDSSRRKKRRATRILVSLIIAVLCLAGVGVGGIFAARHFVQKQGMQLRQDSDTRVEITQTTYDGHPAHTFTIYGKENATVYLKEMQSSYVIAGGKVEVTVPDYMWYDTESSTYATPVETDTMDVKLTPFIRYSQEGDQFQLDPIEFTVDVPLSPIYLLSPSTAHASVGVSIYEVRINVQLGSTVIIDGTNVSTLIRDTGNVSKNVQVLPVGDNTISISVKSKYCRENKMEITLHREPQEIPLELAATVIVEWNYEKDDPLNQASISGTTLPGASITIESPHEDLTLDPATGNFKFKPIFPTLGNNEVIIRASYEGRKDSVISHTVYYMPNADVYTRRAWDLDAQYTDLINYISIRKGVIYTGTGTVVRIISTAPQMAIMNIGTETLEKLVMIENSSKTTWAVGTKYRIYGDVYGLYGNMPRLTVRYTYLSE